jgi:hypothetical protein
MPLQPNEYRLAVASGFYIGPGTAPPELVLGLGTKVSSITTYGVRVVQADIQVTSTAELFDPMLLDQIAAAVDRLGIEWAMHGEIGQHVAFESAIQVLWNISHRKLHQYLDLFYERFVQPKKEKYLPTYVNFHISNMSTIGYIIERFRYAGLLTVDFHGNANWKEFLDKEPALKEWFLDNVLYIIFLREAAIFGTEEEIEDRLIWEAATAGGALPSKFLNLIVKLIPNVAAKLEKKDTELIEEMQKYIERRVEPSEVVRRLLQAEIQQRRKELEIKKAIKEIVYEYWATIAATRFGYGAIPIEEVAYAIVAKYLELHKDDPKEPLWKLFFKDKTLKDLEEEWGKPPKKLVDKETGTVYLHPDIVAMVAARYIIGHFETNLESVLPEELVEKANRLHKKVTELDPFYRLTPFQKLDKIKHVIFCFENPEIAEGQYEGLQRLIHARHMYSFAKAAERYAALAGVGNWIRLLVDFEHWVHNTLDPEKELTDPQLGEDFGKYVFASHVYYPAPTHIHLPFEIGSDAQVLLYSWFYLLRKKGFDRGYIVFERGGPGTQPIEYIRTTVLALRAIIEQLQKDTDPKKLPLEFFGVSPAGFFSEEKQLAVIREHFFDPLKGMLMVPEEEHRFIGGEYLKKPGARPETLKKEEFR